MTPGKSFQFIRLPVSVFWVRDKNRIIVIDTQSQKTLALHGLEAAIWGWLTLNYTYQRLLEFITTALEVAPDEAEKTLLDTLKNWTEAGFLEAQAVTG